MSSKPGARPSDSQRFGAWIRQPETLIALSAVLLSVCGLGIALYEASLIRAAQRASVWPHVEVAASLTDGRVTLWTQNTGVGPARIEAAALSFQDESLPTWSSMLSRVGVPDDSLAYYKSLLNGRVLPAASEKEAIFEVTSSSAAAAFTEAVASAVWDGSIDVEVCYCSVYDECWTTSLRDTFMGMRPDAELRSPQAVRHCTASKRSGI